MTLHIYIPTRGRTARQLTWSKLPAELQKRTLLVSPPEEVKIHEAAGRQVVGCPMNKTRGMCLAATRDWILEYAARQKHRYILLLDDDTSLLTRRFRAPGENPQFLTAPSGDYILAVNWLEEQLHYVVHAAWGMRQHHWDFKTNWDAVLDKARDRMEVTRATGDAMAFDVASVRKLGAQFSKGIGGSSPMSDFNMTLQLFQLGKPNVVSLAYRDNPGPANAPGGCSGYRTAALQSAAAKKLAKLFPDVVKLRKKKAWVGMEGEEMWDVTVMWKKALL